VMRCSLLVVTRRSRQNLTTDIYSLITHHSLLIPLFMNYKLTLQYDGTDFHGWQAQNGNRTVQGELTRVLTLLNDGDVTVHGSGRTDAGVHAEGQIASVVLHREFEPDKLCAAINGNVEHDMRVMRVEAVSNDFHARYSAQEKTYLYRILNARVASPFWTRYAIKEARKLDLGLMRSAAGLFLGEHDWTAFSAAQSDVKSRVRTVTRLEIREGWNVQAQANLIEIEVSANGFLRYMVRSIAGALMAVGRGELEAKMVTHAINSGERPLVVVTAPALGLTLLRVRYD
jgi:tRNA pseudouridine38-40 synthase